MKFSEHEAPVAYSMVRAVRKHESSDNAPFYAFCCYWMAFNNIYVTAADRRGNSTTLRRARNGAIKTEMRGGVKISQVNPVKEHDQIASVTTEFSDDLKHDLIMHQNLRYFVCRTPYWSGMLIERDAAGQRLNGVLNVGHTVSRDHPVWSPVNASSWEQYTGGARDTIKRDELVRQIVGVLYTVRNNTFHGGKRADDANDHEVVEKAVPLLRMIVDSFLTD